MLQFTYTDKAKFFGLDRNPIEYLVGDIPSFLVESDPRKAQEQFNERYSFGGGWNPLEGFVFRKEDKTIMYPEDPPLYAIAEAKFRNQEIYVFEHDWVAIVEEDGSCEVSRMD